MAPKQKITREQLLESAFDITRKEGFSAVTARSVAKAAGAPYSRFSASLILWRLYVQPLLIMPANTL